MRAPLSALLLAAPLLARGAAACGFTIHMTVTHRALNNFVGGPPSSAFAALLAENRGAVEGGSPFPDYGYQCGPDHDDGEYTHWAPFQFWAATWLRASYAAPLNASGRATAAFLAGAVSHYVADISWHGLAETPQDYGLIETIGFQDFNCTGLCSPAHSQADTGGEFVAAYATALAFDDPNAWVVPTADLVAILRSVNRTAEKGHMGAADIEECAVEFYAGAEAIKALAGLAEPLLVYGSPTFAEEILGLPCGGLDDMAVYAARMWQRWAAWLERGPPNPPPGGEYCPPSDPICASAPGAGLAAAQRREGQRAVKELYRVLAPALLDAGLVDVERDSAGGAMRVQRGEALRSAPGARTAAVLAHLRRLLSGEAARAPAPAKAHPALRATRLTQGWTARRESDTDPEAVAALLLSVLEGAGAGGVLRGLAVPEGAGAVAVATAFLDAAERVAAAREQGKPTTQPLAAGATTTPIELQPSVVLAGEVALEYAGSALAAGDFDGDGEVDLVATAPGHTSLGAGAQKLPQSGAFYVRYGGNVSAPVSAPASPAVPLPLALDFSALTEGAAAFERLGAAACALDANLDGVDDLAVSAPSTGFDWSADAWGLAPAFFYVGEVRIFLGARGAGLPPAPSAAISGPANNTHTGLSLSCADVNGDGHADLIIGSHFAFTATTQSGRLDVFLASAAQQAFQPGGAATLDAADYSWRGAGLGEWLGYSAAAVPGAAGASEDEVAALLLRGAASEADGAACAAEAGAAGIAYAGAPAAAVAAAAAAASLLVVGQPGFKATLNGGPAAVGRVSGFAIPHAGSRGAALAACLAQRSRAPLAPAPLFTITADTALLNGPLVSSKLGHGVALGAPRGRGAGAAAVLALGMTAVDLCNSTSLAPGSGASPYKTSAGSVTLLAVGPALRGDLLWSDVTGRLAGALNATVLASALPEARFGWRLRFADLDGDGADDLLVSAPLRTPFFLGASGGVPRNDSGHEAGALFVFRGGGAAAFPFAGAPVGMSGAVVCSAEASAWLALPGQGEFGRFGEATLLARYGGDGGAVPRLLVSAPRVTELVPPQAAKSGRRAAADEPASATIEMPGAVYVFDIPV